MTSRYSEPTDLPIKSVFRRNQTARPWPEGIPTRTGARCDLSDLLITECACRKHTKETTDGPHTAEPIDLDFS